MRQGDSVKIIVESVNFSTTPAEQKTVGRITFQLFAHTICQFNILVAGVVGNTIAVIHNGRRSYCPPPLRSHYQPRKCSRLVSVWRLLQWSHCQRREWVP